jgi:hypothetical protein
MLRDVRIFLEKPKPLKTSPRENRLSAAAKRYGAFASSKQSTADAGRTESAATNQRVFGEAASVDEREVSEIGFLQKNVFSFDILSS